MNLAWNFDGVMVSEVVSARFDGSTLVVSGTGMMRGTGQNGLIPFQWEALPVPGGWHVTYIKLTGKIGSFIGATMNLPLEVATGAKRLL